MRRMKIAAGQLGPVSRHDSRRGVVARLCELMREAHAKGARWIVFPELALTTFFPRDIVKDVRELDRYFEAAMPGEETRALFDLAARLGMGFYLGYAELTSTQERFNSSILVDGNARMVGKYRKVHLPGDTEPNPARIWQQLEKRYFRSGDLGFPVWRTVDGVFGMCICNDRRWPETFRVMGLKGVELVMLGYCTPAENTIDPVREPAALRLFQSDLCLQAGAYQNATFVVAAAKAGVEEGCRNQAGSCIVAPTGQVIARADTEGDEVVCAEIDLDDCLFYKRGLFDFAAHRRIEHYTLITQQAGGSPQEPQQSTGSSAGRQ